MKLIKLAGFSILLLIGCSKNENIVNQNTNVSSARYKLTFNATWSAQTHPIDFPSSAHFSGLIGMTHNKNVNLFTNGTLASDGIKNMAETGSKNPLESEIQNFISLGTGGNLISGGGINSSPGEISLEFNINSSHSLVSIVSMLAPSPDWFIGVSNIDLIENENWVTNKTISVDIYDAGTDDGSTFTSQNLPSNPKVNILEITTPPLATNNIVASLGKITFTKID